MAREPKARDGETRHKVLQTDNRGVQRMAEKKKKNKWIMVRMTDEEMDELAKFAGHYKKSDYIRKAVKVQMASDRIRGNATD